MWNDFGVHFFGFHLNLQTKIDCVGCRFPIENSTNTIFTSQQQFRCSSIRVEIYLRCCIRRICQQKHTHYIRYWHPPIYCLICVRRNKMRLNDFPQSNAFNKTWNSVNSATLKLHVACLTISIVWRVDLKRTEFSVPNKYIENQF